jgi:hypothetical protein
LLDIGVTLKPILKMFVGQGQLSLKEIGGQKVTRLLFNSWLQH